LIWLGLKTGGSLVQRIHQKWFEIAIIVFSILAALQMLVI